MITGDFGEDLQLALVLLALWMAAALPVMKWSARQMPMARLAWAAFVTFTAMLALIALSALIPFLFHRGGTRPPLLVMVCVFFIGAWVMDRRLRREGVAQSFPGIGARAMLSAFAASVIAIAGMLCSFSEAPSGF
jgi:hypothetical protein